MRPVTFVANVCAVLFAFALTSASAFAAGNLWIAGRNASGELGNGTTTTLNKLTRLATYPTTADIVQIAAGDGFSLLVDSLGDVYVTGFNFHGQLGMGNTTSLKVWTKNTSLSGVRAVAAGQSHTLVLKNDGTVWVAGQNNYGQLGDGTLVNRSTFIQVHSNGRAIAAGSWHSIVVQTDGTAWTWGNNTYGQLGNGSLLNGWRPGQIMTAFRDVTAAAGGSFHSVFLRSNGTALAVGWNGWGQLGLGTYNDVIEPWDVTVVSNVVAIGAGSLHSLFIQADGALYATGRNGAGQLGDYTGIDQVTPVKVAEDAASMAAGQWNTFFRRRDGTVWGFGLNNLGQLGNGSAFNVGGPTLITGAARILAAGENHSFIEMPSGPVTVATQPQSQSIAAGKTAVFTTAPSGVPASEAKYQWYFNGTAIPDATTTAPTFPSTFPSAYDVKLPAYFIPSTQRFQAGSYHVVITVDTQTATSSTAALTVTTPTTSGYITNLSTRGQVLGESGKLDLIAGFVLSGSSNSKRMLLRGVGPRLTDAGVTGALDNPFLQLSLASTGAALASNQTWGSGPNSDAAAIVTAATNVGAFSLVTASQDAVLYMDVAPAPHTITISGEGGGTGIALAEIYDAGTQITPPRLVNISSRGKVDSGDKVMIAGFVITGGPVNVLVRAIGPGLNGMGNLTTGDLLANPRLAVFSRNLRIAENEDWDDGDSTAVARIRAVSVGGAQSVGAFALASGANDSAMLITLEPGAYTAQATGPDTTAAGIALIEVYAVPAAP